MISEAFAIKMEGEARSLASKMETAKRRSWQSEGNVKPWYNPRWMFNRGAKRVFLGINPGGDPGNPDGTGDGHVCTDPDSHGEDGAYNSWLCEYWGAVTSSGVRKPDPHQAAVWLAFEAMYGESDWEDVLKHTPTFNVCPLRTRVSESLPNDVWERSKKWCKQVIHELRPKTIICNGNGEGLRSPWSVLRESGMSVLSPIPLNSKGLKLKRGIYAFDGDDADVIAMPSLSRFAKPRLYGELRKLNLSV